MSIAERAATAEENYAAMLETSEAHERRCKDLETLLGSARADLQRQRGEADARAQELGEAKEQFARRQREHEDSLASAQKTIGELERRVGTADAKSLEAQGRVQELRVAQERQVIDLQASIDQLRVQLVQVTDDRETARVAQVSAETRLASESLRVRDAEANAQTRLRELREELERAHLAIANANSALIACTSESAAAKQRASDLQDLLQRKEATKFEDLDHSMTSREERPAGNTRSKGRAHGATPLGTQQSGAWSEPT